MGWWSCTVLGGDTPCDVEHEFKCIALGENANQLFDDVYDKKMSAEQFDKLVHDGMITNFDKLTTAGSEYAETEIRYQVYGLMMMEYGMPVDDPRVVKILNDARQAAKDDDWAHGNEERRGFMNEFIEQIDAYDGTVSHATCEGLFQKLAEALDSAQGGLINK